MLRVLHTVAGLHPDSGGPARTVTSLCAGLGRLHEIDARLLTQSVSGEKLYSGDLGPQQLIVAESKGRLRAKVGSAFRVRLRSELIQNTPDILHDHGVWLPSNHYAAASARKFGIPYVIHTRGMLEPWSLSFSAYKKKIAWNLYQKRNLDSASLFFATSDMESDNIRGLGFSQPIAVVPNGVEIPNIDLSLKCPKPDNCHRNIVFMSRVHPKKGLIQLMTAWAKVRPRGWKLILAGPDEGGHLQEVLDCAQKYGLGDQVEYRGAVEGEAKLELLSNADIFVLPSFSENFGVVVAEALACGVPVITTYGTPWQGLVENRCGWWVEADVEALAAALREAIDLEDDERFEMGLRGQHYASQFDWAEIASLTADVYLWLLGRGERPDCVRLN